MKLRRVGVLSIAGLAVAGAASALFVFHYYRWASAPAAECLTDLAEPPHLRLANQPLEWGNLSANATGQTHYVLNGVDFTSAVYDVPDGSGSQIYAAFAGDPSPYPFHYAKRFDTFESGVPTYRSALAVTCTGDGTPTAVVVDWLPGITPINYRWAYAPAVECIPTGGDVLLRFESQPVKWENLPASAEYGVVYSTNGVEDPSGPFALPTGDGSMVYGALGTAEPAYPVHYAVRLDTLVGGAVVHQSVLVGACEADGPGTSRVYNVPEPAAASLAIAALGALAGLAARSTRLEGRPPA